MTSWNCQGAIDAILSGYALPTPPDLVYDATGNRVSQRAAGGTVTYSTNVRNEYSSVAGSSFGYDRAGRLVDDTMFTFDYNYRGQLVQASQPSGKIVLQVFHDATGRPIGITDGVHSRVLVLDGANAVESYDNGVLAAVFMWESNDRLCFVASEATDRYVMRDVLDSTRLTTDSLGAMIDNYRFDDFGSVVAGTPAIPILYGGKYMYEPIGWYEYRARQYIPSLGRFAQPDPAGFVDGANLYTYVGNNPLSAGDPRGTNRQNVARGAVTVESESAAQTDQSPITPRGESVGSIGRVVGESGTAPATPQSSTVKFEDGATIVGYRLPRTKTASSSWQPDWPHKLMYLYPKSRYHSFELEGPEPPSRAPQDAVAYWLTLHKNEIANAEARWNVNRDAIAGVIAWEALFNPQPASYSSSGPAKMHYTTAGQWSWPEVVEGVGLMKPLHPLVRKLQLRNPSVAIDYNGASLHLAAMIAEQHGWDIRNNPEILGQVYHSWTAQQWQRQMSAKPSNEPFGLCLGRWADG